MLLSGGGCRNARPGYLDRLSQPDVCFDRDRCVSTLERNPFDCDGHSDQHAYVDVVANGYAYALLHTFGDKYGNGFCAAYRYAFHHAQLYALTYLYPILHADIVIYAQQDPITHKYSHRNDHALPIMV